MKQTTLKFAGVALAMALAAVTARADVAIHQNVSVYGYAAGSASYEKAGFKGAKSDTEMDIDAAKLGFAFNFAPVSAKLSFYTDRGASDIYVLEANVNYDLGNGLSITGGRYQSSIGYEAFDIPNTSFITYGSEFGGIPDFTEGVKVNYAWDKFTASLSVVNAIFSGNAYRGDGSLSDGYGVEANLKYADGAFSASATLAYDKAKTPFYNDAETYIADVWAQYVINNKTTLAAELYYQDWKDDSADVDGNSYFVLVMAKQQFNEKFALAGRLSTGKDKTDLNPGDFTATYWKASVVPSYAVTANLDVRAEVSYTKYGKDLKDFPKSNTYVGVQAVFKF